MRGDELGYFAYGGSTIVAVFERDTVEWDEDLLRNSAGENDLKLPLETKVKVSFSLLLSLSRRSLRRR